MKLLDTLAFDIDHYYRINNISPFFKPLLFLSVLFPLNSLYCLAVHRLGTWINHKYGYYQKGSLIRGGLKLFYWIGRYICIIFCKIEIEENVELVSSLCLSNRGGILLGAKKIGNNCIIHHNVTIGYGFGLGQKMERPVLGNDVWVGPSSVIYGDIKIGDGVTIKANSIVNKNIPPHCVVGGNPVRIEERGVDNSRLLMSSTL